MRYQLEILAYSLEACMLAEKSGADRIELCDNPGDGGTTPSAGTIRQAIHRTKIPVFPMIRPRGGDFLYSDAEFDAMREDINICKIFGAQGVVFGLLLADGTVDKARCSRLVEDAYPLDVTFHRAFDQTPDPFQALEDIIACGCTRILTSGQQARADEGSALIRSLVEQAADRIIIMPGSGIRSGNLPALIRDTGAAEFHSSAGVWTEGAMTHRPPLFAQGLMLQMPDPVEVSTMQAILQAQLP
jgi:copper homeostasis protein